MAEHAASVEDIGGQEVASQQGVGRHGQSHGVHGAGRLQLVDPDQDSGTTQQEDDVTRKNVNSTICHATYSVNTGPQKTEETTQPLAGDEGEHNKSNPAVNRDKVVGHSLIIQRSGVLAPASRVDTNDHQNETQHVQEGMAPLENFNVGVRKVTIEENTVANDGEEAEYLEERMEVEHAFRGEDVFPLDTVAVGDVDADQDPEKDRQQKVEKDPAPQPFRPGGRDTIGSYSRSIDARVATLHFADFRSRISG